MGIRIQYKRRGFWIAGLCITLLILLIGWYYCRTPSPTEQLAAIDATRAIPDGNNAAFAYMELLDVYNDDEIPGGVRHNNNFRTRSSPWRSTEFSDIAAWLDSYQPLMDRLESVSRIPDCFFPILESHETLPSLSDTLTSLGSSDAFMKIASNTRQWGYLLQRSAFNDVGEGRISPAMEKAQTCLRIGRHFRRQPIELSFSLGGGLEKQGLHVLAHILVHSDTNSPTLEHFFPPEDLEATLPRQHQTIKEVDQILNQQFVGQLPPWWRLQAWWLMGRQKLETYELYQWSTTRHLMRYRGHRILVALRDIKNQSGEWPDRLPSSTPLLTPNDCIDPLSQKPFVYGRLGDSFYLYSVGDNGRDEQGRFRHISSDQPWDDRMVWPTRQSDAYKTWQATLDVGEDSP